MMKRFATCLLFCALLSSGCRSDSPMIEVTCKPGFDFEPRPELIVTTRDGDRADASDLYLIISDGKQRYRVAWGTPPVYPGPVALFKHQTYTFVLDPTGKAIVSIRKGEKVVYEAPQ